MERSPDATRPCCSEAWLTAWVRACSKRSLAWLPASLTTCVASSFAVPATFLPASPAWDATSAASLFAVSAAPETPPPDAELPCPVPLAPVLPEPALPEVVLAAPAPLPIREPLVPALLAPLVPGTPLVAGGGVNGEPVEPAPVEPAPVEPAPVEPALPVNGSAMGASSAFSSSRGICDCGDPGWGAGVPRGSWEFRPGMPGSPAPKFVLTMCRPSLHLLLTDSRSPPMLLPPFEKHNPLNFQASRRSMRGEGGKARDDRPKEPQGGRSWRRGKAKQ